MGLFGLIFLIVALVVIGIGIALGVVACILTCAFLVLGIASSSFVIGFHRGHPVAGTRAFLVQCGILAGVPAGIVCVWSVQFVFGTGATGWSLGYWKSALVGVFSERGRLLVRLPLLRRRSRG